MKKIRPEIFSSYRFVALVDEYVQGDLNKQILIQFYVNDLTQEEIAEKLNVSVSKVKRECKRFGIPIFRMLEKDRTINEP